MTLDFDPVPSFDAFVATSATTEALDLAKALAAGDPGGPRLLLLHGPPGSGKTHLLRAIVHYAQRSQPSLRLFQQSAAGLLQELVTAASNGSRLDASPDADLVTLDDLQALSDKPVTQAEFARLFEAAISRGCRLACSVGHLDEIPELAKCVHGMPAARVAAIRRPNSSDMLRILNAMATAEGWSLSRRTLRSMAAPCGGDARRGAGAIARLRFQSMLAGSGPDWRRVSY